MMPLHRGLIEDLADGHRLLLGDDLVERLTPLGHLGPCRPLTLYGTSLINLKHAVLLVGDRALFRENGELM